MQNKFGKGLQRHPEDAKNEGRLDSCDDRVQRLASGPSRKVTLSQLGIQTLKVELYLANY